MQPVHESPKPIETHPSEGAPPSEGDSPAVWDEILGEDALENEGGPNRPSAFKFILGLTVIWGSLYLIAYAQTISFNEIRFNFGGDVRDTRPTAFIKHLDVRDKVMTPMDLRFHETSARQIVKLLLSRTGMAVTEEDLSLIGETPRNISLGNRPLYYFLHSIINDPQIGFSLEEKHAQFFAQTIKNTEPATGLLRTFDWAAEVELSSEPALIFPSIRSDLWVLVALRPSSVGPGPYQTRVQVEVWRGSERLATAEDVLSDSSKATLEFSAGGKVLVTIEPSRNDIIPRQAIARSRYKMRIYFEARTEGGDMPPAGVASQGGSNS